MLKRSGVKIPFRSVQMRLRTWLRKSLACQPVSRQVEPVKGYLNLYFQPQEYTRKVVDDRPER